MTGPFSSESEAAEISEVNVVPLADVSLVLLIMLLVLSPMMRQHMLQVRQAGAASAPAPVDALTAAPPDLVLLVGLDAQGYALGERRLTSAAELAGALAVELSRRADKKVFLSPAPDVAMELVVRALETIKTSGAESVALVQTQEPKPNGTLPAAATAP